jgi:photosystem II stability/assembly factor-like uncharacterized protein
MRFSIRLWTVVVCATAGTLAVRADSDARLPLPLDQLAWRHIGPASYGGRIDDIEAVPGRPSTIYVGTASGGVFKTVNNGVTWTPVFDRDGSALSIGDIAIAPTDPNVVWVGTGEANGRQSSSWGDGVYRSLDGGETWQHVGLRETHHIGRVVIHPRDPNIVYVAAMGHLWGPNEQRGLFRTVDGGKTWTNVLHASPDTGAGDVAIGPDGRTLFAALYQRRRRGWGFVGGGPESALYRSLDGGDTWEKLTKGLPSGTIGRIGLDISKSDPNIVYALVENKAAGGVYRSEDSGATWTRQSGFDPRPSYYSQIRIDPRNPNRVWVLGSFAVSIDAGKTFRSEHTTDLIHTDHHALWIDPQDPDHLMLGNDGGLYFSYDGSRNWSFIDNLPIGQYYDVDVDTRDPYWIYGGTQDNGTWAIPSRTTSQLGITNADVVNVAYGDGFYVAVDPKDYRTVYANSQSGRTYLVDLDTREEKGLRPVPQDSKETYRFNWSTPMLLSPHDSNVVYYGGNKLFKTADHGHTWTVISPDLTRKQDWKKLPLMGSERSDDTLSRDDGVSDFGTITTIAESPLTKGVLYVGTDDGNVEMTRDDGKTWQNLTDRFKLPGPRWVSRVVASAHEAATAYVSFDGHQDDDFRPYIFKTTDNGVTWSPIAADIPNGMSVHAVAEDPVNRNLLFAGTEFGLFTSTNGGRNWTLVRGNLPRVRIDDILINNRTHDLILGTHGRSIIVFDDISMLEGREPAAGGDDVRLFPVRPATEYYEMRKLPSPGAAKFSGPNPEYGALITYFLKADAGDGLKILVIDPQGQLVRELDGPSNPGFHRVAWDLRFPLTLPVATQDDGWFGPPKGTLVLPGRYQVKLAVKGRELQEFVDVRIDPRARTSPEALKARFDASQRVAELLRAFGESTRALDGITRELDAIKEAVKTAKATPDEVKTGVDGLSKKVDTLKSKFRAGFGGPKFQYLDLAGQLQASTSEPTAAQLTWLAQLTAELREHITALNTIISGDMPQLDSIVREHHITLAGATPVQLPKAP